MKKIIRNIIVTMLLLVLSLLVCGCDMLINDAVSLEVVTQDDRCKVEKTANPYSSMEMFKDNRYYYYILDVGTVRNVPLWEGDCLSIDKGQGSKEVSKSTQTTESITQALGIIEETYSELSYGVDVGLGNENSKVRVEGGWKKTKGENKTQSYSIENAASVSNEYAEKFNVDFTGKVPGKYKLVQIADVKIYAAVIYDTEVDKYEIVKYSYILGSGYCLSYSESFEFKNSSDGKIEFALDISKVDGKIPEREIGSVTGNPDLPLPPEETAPYMLYMGNGKEQKVDDRDIAGKDIYGEFDFSNLEPYMNANYKFVFSMQIEGKEQEKGYQEVHLFNAYGEEVRYFEFELGGSDKQKSYVWWGSGKDSWKTYDGDDAVSGSKCTKKMHVKLGAWGESEDDWYCRNIKVKIRVELA
ncbi:MAG: hypothetical protein E7349_08625 [Clostridiales bacterium]|nr:hypothetical protein [Clostridiales bacterium]